MSIWYQLTVLGGINVLGPIGLVMALWLCCEKRWRLALDWCLLYGGGIFIVIFSKFLFIGWGIGSQSLDFTGLSGHAMRAAAVFPAMGWLLFYGSRWRNPAALVGLIVAGLVAVSRVQVHAHSWSEALSGAAFGLLVAWLFMQRVGVQQSFRYNRWLALVSLAGLISTPYTPHTPTQYYLIRLTLQITGHPRPFVREGWRYDPYHCVEPEPGRTTFCTHYP